MGSARVAAPSSTSLKQAAGPRNLLFLPQVHRGSGGLQTCHLGALGRSWGCSTSASSAAVRVTAPLSSRGPSRGWRWMPGQRWEGGAAAEGQLGDLAVSPLPSGRLGEPYCRKQRDGRVPGPVSGLQLRRLGGLGSWGPGWALSDSGLPLPAPHAVTGQPARARSTRAQSAGRPSGISCACGAPLPPLAKSSDPQSRLPLGVMNEDSCPFGHTKTREEWETP